MGPKKPLNINLKKWAVKVVTCRLEENIKKGRTKKLIFIKTATAVLKEIAVIKKLLTKQIMQSTVLAVVVLL